MFTPIKNLLTYIHKNASGSTFFGGTSSSTELNESATTMESELPESNCNSSTSPVIELPSVGIKNHDQNENEVLEAISSVTCHTDDPLLIQEDEVEKDIFLDFPAETENEENDVDFPTNEVIVLEDPDLNASINSDPGTDPLAIDDCNVPPLNSPNPLDTSTDGNVLYMVDIDEIESKPLEITDAQVLAAAKAADEHEIRSDGSDSGLGSETSALQSTVTSVADMSTCSTASTSPIDEKVPLRSNLKRRLHEDVSDGEQLEKKPRRSINFDSVKVFYFPRIQGHGCIPSQGGCTLGMGAHHISFKTFTLAEHAAELRRAHKLQLQEINPRASSSDDSDSDEELSEGSGSDLDTDTNGFLQPVSPKQRRALLKVAGVRKIDPNEKIECRDIRNSREVCGCACRDFCDPDTCACSQAGIKCQVDRSMFPCGCSRDACGNVHGRIEFNPARVRTHYIHTIMRLEMENRQQKRSHEIGSQLGVASVSHLAYNSVPAIANSTTGINSYNTIPSYGLEHNSTAVFHHHQMQQHNAYMNHMPPTHPASGVYASIIEPPIVALPLPQPHSHYVNTTAIVEPESIGISSGNLLYQDVSIYPAVQSSPLPQPTAAAYGDILAPYATSTPYHSAQVADSSYSASVYNSYHSPHHLQNHLSHHQPQQPFLGYTTACSGDLHGYTESQSSFISLNTPEASSSRLSAINDLLHNNRNTTAALIAVSPVPSDVIPDEASVVEDEVQETLVSTSEEADDCEINVKVEEAGAVEKDQKEEENTETTKETPSEIEETPSALIEQADDKLSELTDSAPTPTKPKEDDSPPVSSPKEDEAACSPDETVINPIISKNDSTTDEPPATGTETEEERITDVLTPIVETVSA